MPCDKAQLTAVAFEMGSGFYCATPTLRTCGSQLRAEHISNYLSEMIVIQPAPQWILFRVVELFGCEITDHGHLIGPEMHARVFVPNSLGGIVIHAVDQSHGKTHVAVKGHERQEGDNLGSSDISKALRRELLDQGTIDMLELSEKEEELYIAAEVLCMKSASFAYAFESLILIGDIVSDTEASSFEPLRYPRQVVFHSILLLHILVFVGWVLPRRGKPTTPL